MTVREISAKRRWLRWLLEALLFLLLLFLLHLWQTRQTASGDAPSLHGLTLTGETFTLSPQPEAPLLVHFWATWCPVCRLEMGNVAALLPEHRVISVAMQSGSDTEIRAYLEAQGLAQIPVISDPEGSLAKAWGVRGVPTSFVVDRHGRIGFVEVGYTTTLGLRARLWWAQ